MIAGTKTLKTYWVDEAGGPTRREVILDGSCGDKCGYVRCIETGERWMTYGYTTLAQAGEVIMTYQLGRAPLN